MAKYMTFRKDLSGQLKDKKFKISYEKELRRLRLGEQIATVRKKLGLTQKELATRLDTSQGAITRLESGDYTGYSLRTLEKIAATTGARLEIRFRL